MNNRMPEEQLFEQLAHEAEYPDAGPSLAPARLKAKIYTKLVKRQQESGPLASLTETKAAGSELCVFESLWTIAPFGENMKCRNLCSVCHARVLAENLERAPIYWPGCPYADFQKT